MLSALLGGERLPAGDLAKVAGIAPPTASEHLARLLDAGLVVCIPSGRHRYYGLAGAHVAGVLEALDAIAPPRTVRTLADSQADEALRFARTCWDHLAGRLGVALSEALLSRGVLRVEHDEFLLTRAGEDWCGAIGVDLGELRQRRRRFTRACIDWSERRPHLAGALGAGLAQVCFHRAWIRRIPGGRALRVTESGTAAFSEHFGLLVEARAKRILSATK